jgi:predicted methyltransferase
MRQVRAFAVLFALTLAGCGASPRATSPSASPPGSEPHHHHEQAAFHHDFHDAAGFSRMWDAPERDAWQKPEQVLALLDVKPDSRVADIGAGTGYFTVRLARAAPQGRVYAVDVEESMLAFIAKRAAGEGLANIEPIHATPDDPALVGKIDRVLVCDTYHHLGNRAAYFARLAGALAPGARVMIVDFARDRGGPGPPNEHRIAEADVVSELGEAGYTLLRAERELLPHQYLLLFERAR